MNAMETTPAAPKLAVPMWMVFIIAIVLLVTQVMATVVIVRFFISPLFYC